MAYIPHDTDMHPCYMDLLLHVILPSSYALILVHAFPYLPFYVSVMLSSC